MMTPDVSIIGGGLAGLCAAVEAAASGAAVTCFESAPFFGGLVANVGRLDDYPGVADLGGAALAEELVTRAKALDVAFVTENVSSLTATAAGTTIVAGALNCRAKVAIVASGARLRRLGIPGESELTGRGVSQCDWCDGGLYRGRHVAVVGGGNGSVQAALHLAELCEKVTLITRGETLRARRDLVLRAADTETIEFQWQTVIDEVIGTNAVERLRLRTLLDDTRSDLVCDALFVFAGLLPNLDFASDLPHDDAGFALTDAHYRTASPRVFVVGAARSGNCGSLISAMGEGSSAATSAIADLRRFGEL